MVRASGLATAVGNSAVLYESARRAGGPRWHTSRVDATSRAAEVFESLGGKGVSADRRPPIQGGWGGCSGSGTRESSQSADVGTIGGAWGRGATGMGQFRGLALCPRRNSFPTSQTKPCAAPSRHG